MSNEIQSYRDLIAWQKAMAVSFDVYQATSGFPADERFGLTSQLRRASVSIPSNIAEGYGRGSRADYLRFLRTARGSLFEVETQLLIATRLGFIEKPAYDKLTSKLEDCGRELAGLIRSVKPATPANA